MYGEFSRIKFLAIKLASKGYYGGNVKQILQEDFSTILDILEYEQFDDKLEAVIHQMNQKKT